MRLLVVILAILFPFSAIAADEGREDSGLPLPRFASMKSNNVFARTGPSMDYPIRWVYKREGLPVEIIQEYDVWRKIKDPDGQQAWVHKILLSGHRMVMVRGDKPVNAYADADHDRVVAKLEPQVIAETTECDEEFCKLELMPFEGWVEKKHLWGVYPSEILN